MLGPNGPTRHQRPDRLDIPVSEYPHWALYSVLFALSTSIISPSNFSKRAPISEPQIPLLRMPWQEQWGDAKLRVFASGRIVEGFNEEQLIWLERWEEGVNSGDEDGESSDEADEEEKMGEELQWEAFCGEGNSDSGGDFVPEDSEDRESDWEDIEDEDWSFDEKDKKMV